MTAVTVTEFTRNFGHYSDVAQREAVAITMGDRVTGYFMSAHDYGEYRRLKALAPLALAVDELDAETLKALASVRMDTKHDHLNALNQ